ncbi:MAG: alanine-zipper protein [Gammaproteobacteria bacterium]|nr:alanine-zipper protein [Gammaproteobacteria bacterium]
MTRSISAVFGIPALVLLLAVSAGCATNKDLAEVRAIAEDAQQTANEAKAMAADASATANEANQRTMETDQKIDEMFRKTMQK